MTIEEAVGGKPVKLGDQGEAVRAVQVRLRAVGFALKGTGYFGNATDTAVRAFQRRAGETADGVVGRDTARSLDAAGGQPAAARPPEMQAEVGRPLWLLAGLALVGTKEGAGATDNRAIIDWAKEEGGDVAKNYTHDSIPWCALFANHVLTKVGLPGTETLWALDFAGKWPSTKLEGPAVGAFAPMLRDGGGHIAIVVGRDQHGNVMGLGGNQHDQVSVAPFARSRLNKGFWWPSSVPIPIVTGFAALPIVRSDGTVSTAEA